jgi:hypothetical protein
MKNESEVTLKSVASQLDRIEKKISEIDKKSKEEKDWRDLWELGGLFLLGAGVVYLFTTGGIAAVIDGLKNIFLLA